MMEIKVTRGEESKVHRFEESRIRIGRNEDNDLVLSSRACSRYHAEVVQEGTTYKIVDLGSSNGIQLGSRTLTEVVLVDGRTVVVGEHELTFRLADEASDKTVLIGRAESSMAGGAEPSPQKEPSVLYLVYRRDGQAQSLKVVQGAEYVIGRAPDADLYIDDRKSSAHHALVFSRANRFSIRDTESSNGTKVNGKKIDEAPLEAGDQIRIGDTVITVQEQRHELSDQANLMERTVHVPSPKLDPSSALPDDRAVVGRSKTSAGVGVAVGVAAGILIAAGVFFVLSGGGGDKDEGTTGALSSTGTGSRETDNEELLVQVASIQTKELVRSIDGTGTVNPRRRVTVSAEVPGRIVELPVEEGAVVKKGQLLARVNDTDIRLQIDEARSSVSQDRVDLAREDFERKKQLADDGVISKAILDQSEHHYLSLESQYNSTQARIRQLQEQLGKTRITAPMSGRVAKRTMNQGEVAAAGMPILILENMEEVLVDLELSDRDIVKVQKGQPVEATTDAFPGRIFLGVLENIASSAQPVTRTFRVEARIGNQDGSLRSGMITSLRIVLEKSHGLVVPTEALLGRRGEDAEVFVVAGGIARKVPVRLGSALDREVEVVAGLAEGDEVIVYGKEQVRDGQPIGSYQKQ